MEDLRISLALELTHNPEGVLSMVGPTTITLQQACSVPFIEGDAKTEEAHVVKVRNALRPVKKPSLASQKKQCLDIINADAGPTTRKP